VVDVCSRIRQDTGLNKVCLSGGVFQNTVLLGLSTQQLKLAGFEVFYPRQLPANDGGLSLGQAVIALSKVDALDLRTQARS
jgi:hydrogenase maturation protein HypF